jgi:hypothetical protein
VTAIGLLCGNARAVIFSNCGAIATPSVCSPQRQISQPAKQPHIGCIKVGNC